MSPSRREALAQLAALVALPLPTWASVARDPLDGTIADYQVGRRRGDWTAAQVTARALERCGAEGRAWRARSARAQRARPPPGPRPGRARAGGPRAERGARSMRSRLRRATTPAPR